MSDLLNITLNNLKNIQNAIEACAREHNKSLAQDSNDQISKKKLLVNLDQFLTVLDLYEYDKRDVKRCSESISKLNSVLKELSMCPVLVKSVFSDSHDNCFVTPAYDVLKIIFLNSTENFRQHHFHDLTHLYYEELLKLNPTIKQKLDRREYQVHVSFLLPYIKLEALLHLSNDKNFRICCGNELIKDFDLYLIHPRFSKEDAFEVIRNKVGSSNYDLISFDLRPLDEQRGHLGHYFHLNIYIKINESTKSFRLFVKYVDQENTVIKKLIYDASLNEAFFYGELVNEFKKLKLEDLLTFAPKCYLNKPSDLLILDDMNCLGFKEIDHYVMLPYEGIKSIASQLAKYHACSFILEESLSKMQGRFVGLDEIYNSHFKELIFVSQGPSRESFESFWLAVDYMIDFFESEIHYCISSKEFKEKVQRKVKDTFFEKLTKSTRFRNCICHGDLYASNTVLKERNGTYIDACLLDFQTMRYLPPAHDLLLLIYINTTKQTRDAYFKPIIDDYYSELSRCLSKHNINILEIYTKEAFLESVEFMKSQALNHAFMYSHALKLPAELKKNLFGGENHVYYLILNRIKLVQRSMHSELFRAVQKDYIMDLYEFCINE